MRAVERSLQDQAAFELAMLRARVEAGQIIPDEYFVPRPVNQGEPLSVDQMVAARYEGVVALGSSAELSQL